MIFRGSAADPRGQRARHLSGRPAEIQSFSDKQSRTIRFGSDNEHKRVGPDDICIDNDHKGVRLEGGQEDI